MTDATLHDDLLIGAAAIADFIYGSTEYKYQRRVYYLNGAVPVGAVRMWEGAAHHIASVRATYA